MCPASPPSRLPSSIFPSPIYLGKSESLPPDGRNHGVRHVHVHHLRQRQLGFHHPPLLTPTATTTTTFIAVAINIARPRRGPGLFPCYRRSGFVTMDSDSQGYLFHDRLTSVQGLSPRPFNPQEKNGREGGRADGRVVVGPGSLRQGGGGYM